MNANELFKESKRIALHKFEQYLDAEYQSTAERSERSLKELTKAKREWQQALNNYYRFLEILDKQKLLERAGKSELAV